MYRTAEEEREYQNLSSNLKTRYDFEASQDSSLTHKQIMQLIGFKITVIEEGLRKGNINVNLDDNRVKKSILEKVGDFLRDTAPSVWRSVRDAFYSAISYLGDLIERGILWVADNIVAPVIEILDDIFS